MVKDDVEIEIKIPLSKSAFLKTKIKLKKIAKFSKRSHQIDEYFTPVHRNFVAPRYPFEWLSIRRRGDKVVLNYKHFYPENTKIFTHCDEFETEIAREDKLQKIFSALNFKILVTVDKIRETYISNDSFEIALDKVRGLGDFIEIEAKKNFGSIGVTREKLFEFAKNLGIDITKTDLRGYPFLLMEKRGLIK